MGAYYINRGPKVAVYSQWPNNLQVANAGSVVGHIYTNEVFVWYTMIEPHGGMIYFKSPSGWRTGYIPSYNGGSTIYAPNLFNETFVSYGGESFDVRRATRIFGTNARQCDTIYPGDTIWTNRGTCGENYPYIMKIINYTKNGVQMRPNNENWGFCDTGIRDYSMEYNINIY